MAIRPMLPDERDYLESYKASLEEALRGFWLTLGLWGLPAGFLIASFAPHHMSSDRVAVALAGGILLALVGAIISYSPQGGRSRRLNPADFRLPGRLDTDLLAGDVEEVTVTVDEKLVRPKKARGEHPRRYYIKAGGREIELTGLRWMNLAPGQSLTLAIAPHAGMALEVEGLRERLPMLTAKRRDGDREGGPLEGPYNT